MRIAFPMLGLGGAGGVKVCARLADSAILRGHSAALVVPDRADRPPYETKADIIVVPPFPSPSTWYLRQLTPSPMVYSAFPIAKRLRGFDAVIANFSPSALPTKLVGGRNVRRYYIVQHDEATYFPPWTPEHWVAKLSYSAFDDGRYFVVSQWLKDMVRRRSGHDPVIIPPGIDHDNYRPRERTKHEGKQVLVLSRPDRTRGLEVFSKAMDLVAREIKDVRIIAAGKTAASFDTVCPVERIHPSDDDLARLYSSCDVYVLPSYLEGMPVPPLEAMACGGAVVVTDCLGSRDFAANGTNCLMVPRGNPEALAQAIAKVLTDEALAEKLRRNGPETASKWTYERMGSIFVDALESG